MTDFTNNSPIGIKKKKLNVSIGFYVMVDSNDSPQPDLRTRFWEPQLKDATGDISRYYLSEGIYTVNGIEFTILPEGTASINDSNKCVRFSQSWVHFMRYHKKTKWYFRAETETYINVTNLGNFMIDREKELDPLRKPHMNFNVVASSNSLYPSLISGVLISNHAVKSLVEFKDFFVASCMKNGEMIAFSETMSKIGLNMTEYISNKFIPLWPKGEHQIITQKEYFRVLSCGDTHKIGQGLPEQPPMPVRSAVSIFMDFVPMKETISLLKMTPFNLAVTYRDLKQVLFCKTQQSKSK